MLISGPFPAIQELWRKRSDLSSEMTTILVWDLNSWETMILALETFTVDPLDIGLDCVAYLLIFFVIYMKIFYYQ